MHINAPVIAVVAKFMTASAVAVNAPARNEKENTSQAPALSEVQSSRRVGGSPAKESPARHVSLPPARGCPVYKESAGAAAGPGRKQGGRAPTAGAAPEPGDVSSLRALRAQGSAEGPCETRGGGGRGASQTSHGAPQGAARSRGWVRALAAPQSGSAPAEQNGAGFQRGFLRAALYLLGRSARPRVPPAGLTEQLSPLGRSGPGPGLGPGCAPCDGPVAMGKARHGWKRKFRELTKLTFFLDF